MYTSFLFEEFHFVLYGLDLGFQVMIVNFLEEGRMGHARKDTDKILIDGKPASEHGVHLIILIRCGRGECFLEVQRPQSSCHG